MFIYVLLEAIAAIVIGVMLVKRTKMADGVVYGKLDKVGCVTNVILTVLYSIVSPIYLFLGMLCEPDGEGLFIILGFIVSFIAASAALFCGLGLGFSVALRRKGRSGRTIASGQAR